MSAEGGNYATAYAKLNTPGGSLPLSVEEYTSALLANNGSTSQNGASYNLDNSSNVWDPTQANGNFTGAYSDHGSQTLYVVHANYTGPQITTSVGSLALPVATLTALSTLFNQQRAQQGLPPVPDASSYTLIILGVALLAAAALIAVFAPEAVAWIWLFRVALAVSLVALTAGVADYLFTPVVQSSTCNASSTSCCSLLTGIGGASNVCTNCTTSGCSTSVTTTGGIGLDLTSIAFGLAAIAVVGLGAYAGYRYIAGRPRPGFARVPPPPVPTYGMGVSAPPPRAVGYTPASA